MSLKRKILLFVLMLFGSILLNTNFVNASVSYDSAYKAIVMIKSFTLNENFKLEPYSQGSGIIISSDGIVLTNHHVINTKYKFDDSDKISSYQICITESIENEPDCSYVAELIASDKNLDLALLKIENISGISNKTSFDYLNLNFSDTTKINDEVTVIGYPGIGGDTISITKGIISGKVNKYGNSWLKTDAVVSHGNSGGAGIDKNGRVVGIATRAHSDLLGSLGYLINSSSIYNWVNSNKNKIPQTSQILKKIKEFIIKEKELKNTNTFTDNNFGFSITKQNDWQFKYLAEDLITITKNQNEDEGGIIVGVEDFPYKPTFDNIISYFNMSDAKSFGGQFATYTNDGEININNNKGIKIIMSLFDQRITFYVFTNEQYIIFITKNYGKNDKNKNVIDNMINSFTLKDIPLFIELNSYSQDYPNFSITNNNWAIKKINSKKNPITILSRNIKSAFGDINLAKIDESKKNLSPDEFLQSTLKQIEDRNKLSFLDEKTEVLDSNAHSSLEIKNGYVEGMSLEYVKKSATTDKISSYNYEIMIKVNDVYFIISMNNYTGDKLLYQEAKKSFIDFLKNLNIPNATIVNQNTNTPQIKTPPENKPEVNKNVLKTEIIKNINLYKQLRGKIILKVESHGEAYYIHPETEKYYYLGRPKDAFAVMREQGRGISNYDLEKIPIGLTELSGDDSDNDGLSDIFEDAIGTDKNNSDSDNDGYDDKTEIANGYTPLGRGRYKINKNFSSKYHGQIFLQVEKNGEAWYVNPNDGKRYFLGRPKDAFNIMRNLGLGISNQNFDSLN